MSNSVKIRGIYATALTELLRSKKFNIADASEELIEKMELDEEVNSADNLIYDKEDLNGITIHGENSYGIIDIMRNKFKDSLFRKVETGAICGGIIKKVDQEKKNIYVDLGKDKEGLLSLRNFWGYLKEGEKVLVQIKGETNENYLLSTRLRLFGKYLILIKDGFMKVSKHVKDSKEIARLTDLSKEIDTKGWGILWKSLAEKKSNEELKNEINELLKEEEKIVKEFSEIKEPSILNKGICIWFIDFGKKSKEQLDKIRSKATSTIDEHHMLKSAKYSHIVDFIEELKSSLPKEEKKIKETLKKTIYKNSPSVGQTYRLFQKKANGKTICVKGIIENWDKKNKEITLKRIMKIRNPEKQLKYDGLDVDIENEDYIITKIKDNSNQISHEYFDKDGKKKGIYISITTNIELLPRFARCIDLEIDVIEKDGKMQIIDQEDLKNASESGIITKTTEQQAIKIAETLRGGK